MIFLLAIAERLAAIAAGFSTKIKTKVSWWKIGYKIRAVPELRELYEKFRRSPHASWSIAANDVLRLYELVLDLKPTAILEYGTGIGFSTAVMALALRKLGRGKITTLEQRKECVAIAEELINKDLLPFVEFVYARPKVFRIEEISPWLYFCGYDWRAPSGAKYDFVLVDGPASWLEENKLIPLDPGDVFTIIPALAPDARVYIDGRRTAVKKIRRYLSNYLILDEGNTEFSVFKRTEAPIENGVVFSDTKLSGVTPYARTD